MRKLTALAAALAMATSASAATFTAGIVLPEGNTVSPGGSLAIEVHGQLSTAADNDGLVFVSVDITASGPADMDLGQAVMWGAPSNGSMDNFVQPLGYDANYGGTAVGLDLLQSGGAQNTIGNNPAEPPLLAFPSAEFITFNVAHSNQIILQGELTIPADQAAGSYTLSLENVLANVLANGQSATSFGVYSVEAADGAAAAPVVIDVSEDCPAPGVQVGVAGVSFNDRMFDGFIDARRESTNGVALDQGLSTFKMVFTTEMEDADGSPLSADSFSLAQTGGGAVPAIMSVTSPDAGRTAVVTLANHITLQQWTTFTVNCRTQCAGALLNSSIDVGFLPADVDQDRLVGPFDLLKFRQYVNGVGAPPTRGVVLDYTDTNRDGSQGPFDLLSFRQLVNGVSPSTRVWQGQDYLRAEP